MTGAETPPPATDMLRLWRPPYVRPYCSGFDAVLAELHPLTLLIDPLPASLEKRAGRVVAEDHFGIVKAPAETARLREDALVSDETDAKAAAGWSFTVLGTQRIPVHCGHMADDLDLGEWECRGCDAVTHVRDIPGWRDSTRG